MKKFFIMMVALLSAVSLKAQTAIETSKAFDNVGIGVHVGATTPLDMNDWLPLNTTVGIRLQKEVTPIFGFQVDGDVFLNDNHFADIDNVVKATNVGLNGTINLNNLFCGYNGNRRLFEVKTVTGLGWLHLWNTSANALSAKTGLSLAFNLGKHRAHSLSLDPMVWWNLTPAAKVQFNKNHAQLGLGVSYIYHFKNSNGTHSFKKYDIEAMLYEIAKKPKVEEKIVTKEKTIFKEVVKALEPSVVTVFFAQGSSELTDDAKTALGAFKKGDTVEIVATASPEGTKEFNDKVSQERADKVADFLKNKEVNVIKANGLGVVNDASNRVAIITAKR